MSDFKSSDAVTSKSGCYATFYQRLLKVFSSLLHSTNGLVVIYSFSSLLAFLQQIHYSLNYSTAKNWTSPFMSYLRQSLGYLALDPYQGIYSSALLIGLLSAGLFLVIAPVVVIAVVAGLFVSNNSPISQSGSNILKSISLYMMVYDMILSVPLASVASAGLLCRLEPALLGDGSKL
jgi:hypothetical protein